MNAPAREPLCVLIACERSGTVREAFRAMGHNACSCDLEPADDENAHHRQMDALQAVREPWYDGRPWDLVIAHPPCTYLSNSGALRLYKGGKFANGIDADRWEKMERAALFFRQFFDLQRELGFKLCVENPIQHGHAMRAHGCGKPTQTVQPFEFGDDASKRTAFWLRGLPPLVIDPKARRAGRWVALDSGRRAERWENQTDSGQNKLPPSLDRARKRSVTYGGIARAMAAQWGCNALVQDELFT